MFVIFFLVFFFIYILNFLFPVIINKTRLENKLFQTGELNLFNTVTCQNNYWVYISKSNRNLNIYYYTRNDAILTCETTPSTDDKIVLCGYHGEYYEPNGPCYLTYSTLLYLMQN